MPAPRVKRPFGRQCVDVASVSGIKTWSRGGWKPHRPKTCVGSTVYSEPYMLTYPGKWTIIPPGYRRDNNSFWHPDGTETGGGTWMSEPWYIFGKAHTKSGCMLIADKNLSEAYWARKIHIVWVNEAIRHYRDWRLPSWDDQYYIEKDMLWRKNPTPKPDAPKIVPSGAAPPSLISSAGRTAESLSYEAPHASNDTGPKRHQSVQVRYGHADNDSE